MSNFHNLNKGLSSLRLLKRTGLVVPLDSFQLREFKVNLLHALKDGGIPDRLLINAADCLYDFDICDHRIASSIAKVVESREGIITRELRGGLLWSYYNSGPLNASRRKVINSSCRVLIREAINNFRNLRVSVTDITHFEPLLKDYTILGKCYKIPVSLKARLTDSILEATPVLELALECNPLLLPFIETLISLDIQSKEVASVLLDILNKKLIDNKISTEDTSRILTLLSQWNIDPFGGRAIDTLRENISRFQEVAKIYKKFAV